MQKQIARIKYKNNLFKKSAYNQNNNIKWYFHIFKAQNRLKVRHKDELWHNFIIHKIVLIIKRLIEVLQK